MISRKSYRPPTEDLAGVKTLVKPSFPQVDDQKEDRNPDNTEKQQVLPDPPWSKSKPIGETSFNLPERIPYRTLDTEGEDYGHPYNTYKTAPTRRIDMTAAVGGPPYPSGQDRQHTQTSQARMYYKKYYQSHRDKIKRRMQVWHKKHKNQFNYKIDKKRRNEHPDKFTRRPGGYSENKDRSRDYREKQASLEFFNPIYLVHIPSESDYWFLGVDSDSGQVLVGCDENVRFVRLREFLTDFVAVEDSDVDSIVDDFDEVFEYGEMKTADFFYEKRPPKMEPDTEFDRAKESPWKTHKHKPSFDPPDFFIYDNPGSAKVIPEGHDFVNKQAATMSDIEEGLDSSVKSKADGIIVKLIRVNKKNRIWAFKVEGSKGETYIVKVKAKPGRSKFLTKADVLVSCTCPFFRWQGPEHWALQEDYLLGKPKGTAAKPDMKDPEGKKRICKHLLSVFRVMQTNNWSV